MNRPRGYMVDFCPRCTARMPRATAEQHAVLQGVLEDIALQLPWPSQELIAKLGWTVEPSFYGPDWWWEMIIPAFDRLKEHDIEMVPSIDGIGVTGNGFDFVRGARRRRRLNHAEISEIIEYARAWAIDQGVKLREFKEKKRAA